MPPAGAPPLDSVVVDVAVVLESGRDADKAFETRPMSLGSTEVLDEVRRSFAPPSRGRLQRRAADLSFPVNLG